MRKTFPAYTSEKALGNTYGDNLIKAVKEFQKRSGLEADGYFGKLTLAELEKHGFKK
jgi:murein L,D-transpeptidase YcbB/YkuD